MSSPYREQLKARVDNSGVALRGGRYVVVLGADHDARVGDCRDCSYLAGYVNWWCKNEDAIKTHSTRMPGRSDCAFWTEARRKPESAPVLTMVASVLRKLAWWK